MEYNLNGLTTTDLVFLEAKHRRTGNNLIASIFRKKIAQRNALNKVIATAQLTAVF